MRIIVATGLNQGAAEYQNIGDIAMLQVAVDRLAELWPDCEILVLTDSEVGLARFCPQAKALSRYGAETWTVDGVITGPLHLMLPKWLTVHIRKSKRWLRLHCPGVIDFLLRSRFRLHDGEGRGPKVNSFVDALRYCDLLVVAGCGGFADSCPGWNRYALGLIEGAVGRSKPVALFGQGLGPLGDQEVLDRMKRVLPRVSLFASRGTEGAETIAHQMGIPSSAFMTTGDDAVEPAYIARAESPGSAIGINLRVAPYSGITAEDAKQIGAVLRSFAESRNAELIPLPIALHSLADDRKSIQQVLGAPVKAGISLESPKTIYAQTASCRIVVTGAYHAAVFALAQGIPTVCIYGSDYYASKFGGLRALFGVACIILNVKQKDWDLSLRSYCESSWAADKQLIARLRERACDQIAASRRAYLSLRELPSLSRSATEEDPEVLSIP